MRLFLYLLASYYANEFTDWSRLWRYIRTVVLVNRTSVTCDCTIHFICGYSARCKSHESLLVRERECSQCRIEHPVLSIDLSFWCHSRWLWLHWKTHASTRLHIWVMLTPHKCHTWLMCEKVVWWKHTCLNPLSSDGGVYLTQLLVSKCVGHGRHKTAM